MEITELESAVSNQEKIKEIDGQIKAFVDLRNYATRHNNNLDQQIYASKIRALRLERHNLHESQKYVRYKLFVQVIKTYLTREQYGEAWEKVKSIIETNEFVDL